MILKGIVLECCRHPELEVDDMLHIDFIDDFRGNRSMGTDSEGRVVGHRNGKGYRESLLSCLMQCDGAGDFSVKCED